MTNPPADKAPDEAAVSTASRSGAVGRGVRVLLFLASGFIAGVIAWAVVSRTIDFHSLPPDVAAILSQQGRTAEENDRVSAAVHSRDFRTTALSAAILGASLGALLGLASGIASRAWVFAAVGTIAGLIAGGLFGAAGGAAGTLLLDRMQPLELDVTVKAIAASALIFLLVGIGVSLAAEWGSNRRSAAAFEAAVAGLLAGAAVPVLGAATFPVVDTDLAVPRESGPLLLWCLVPAFFIAVAIGRLKPAPKRH